MSKKINGLLTLFAQQELVLGYNTTERDKIKSSLSHLEGVLKNKLGNEISEIIRFGSFTRNTILPRKYDPQSDVDLMVVFKDDSKKPETYRTKLRDVLDQAYPNSLSKKDFPVVKLELNHIMFDLVPAIKKAKLWNGYNYYIPNRNNFLDDWQITYPNDINEAIQNKNQQYGNNIVRNVIRLCKHWNASAKYPFESYVLEKWIIDRWFFPGDNLYDKFLSVLTDLVYDKAYKKYNEVENIINQINKHIGNWLNQPNEEKQIEWLLKLLPGLKQII